MPPFRGAKGYYETPAYIPSCLRGILNESRRRLAASPQPLVPDP
jgi:hypothetical protein